MIYLCLGRREQGKTTLALYLSRACAARVLFDPRGLMPVPIGGMRVTRPDDLRPAFDDLWEDVVIHQRRADIVLTPDGRVQPFFERASAEVKRWVREPGAPTIGYVVDELRFVDPNTEAFDWLCRCATRAQVTIVATAHRPADVPTDLRAITDVWCLFQATQEHDLKVIEERCSDRTRRRVQLLNPREFVAWDDSRAALSVHSDPRIWYQPLVGSPSPETATSPLPPETFDTDRLFP